MNLTWLLLGSTTLCKIARDYSGVPVVNGDVRALPLESGSFPAASAVASFLHLKRSDISGALAEIFRVLGNGGLLFSSVKGGIGEAQDRHGRWITYFQLEEWKRLLERSGFSLLEMEESYERRKGALLSEDVTWINSTCVKS
jgi:ubiquinone/menaquinone biosynthesis C-methylase UbiE